MFGVLFGYREFGRCYPLLAVARGRKTSTQQEIRVMALELRYPRSKWWYGRVAIGDRRLLKNLGVEIRGEVPEKLTMFGDPVFERSRAKAQAALEKLQLDLKKRSTAEELVQAIHEIRTGSRVQSIPLADAGTRWKALPRRRPLSARYVSQAEIRMLRPMLGAYRIRCSNRPVISAGPLD
jgi:hypothetical protein